MLVTLPTQPNAVRLRLWRALKALGCGALRDGAYLLPAGRAAAFEPLVDEVHRHGGVASVFDLGTRSGPQAEALKSLFDRSEAYAQWRQELQSLRSDLGRLNETGARRRWRALGESLQAIQAIDDFPGPALAQAQSELETLRLEIDARHASGEPRGRAAGAVLRLERGRFVGKRWATRKRPWVDRLACCWLIRRFIDPKAEFVWLDDVSRAPRGALGFDFDGARFSHMGARVSFEVMAAAFGLEADARLQRVGAAVHYLDVGGIPVPEAPGLAAILAGLRELHADDDRLVHASLAVFDAFYASAAAPA